MSRTIRLLVVDDHQMFCDGINAMFHAHEHIHVMASANSGEAALEVVSNQPIEVVLMDINMPGMGGLEATSKLCQLSPGIKVIGLTSYLEKDLVSKLLDRGAAGYVLKNTGKEELEEAINSVMEGERYLSADVARAMVDAKVSGEYPDEMEGDNLPVQLTDREKDILRLIAREATTKEIADQLNLSPYTVETHRKNLMRKLDVRSLAGLVRFAVEHGLT